MDTETEREEERRKEGRESYVRLGKEPPKELEATVSGTHIGLGIVPVPTSQTGKPSN